MKQILQRGLAVLAAAQSGADRLIACSFVTIFAACDRAVESSSWYTELEDLGYGVHSHPSGLGIHCIQFKASKCRLGSRLVWGCDSNQLPEAH